MNKKVLKHGLINAGATTAYILLVVTMMLNAEIIFGAIEPEDNILVPVVMLILFVVSAAVTGFLVLGRPMMWYMDGERKEALQLLVATLGFLVIFGLFFVLILL